MSDALKALADARHLLDISAVQRGGEGLFDHFAVSRPTTASPAAMLSRLDVAANLDALTRALDDLVLHAESTAREGRLAQPSEILHQLVRREREAAAHAKTAFAHAIRRLATSKLLRAVATELTRVPTRREEHIAVLARAGEQGADALIEELIAAQGRRERRVYFDALVQLQAGVPTLLHMLGDPRWFVVRNAAALLGEMRVAAAERPLDALLRHEDERVRHAAMVALMRLGTARSMPAIERALRDDAPQIRMQAAAALETRREPRATTLLLRALDDERDDEVRAAFLHALGRLSTTDAVKRLIAAAQPGRVLLRRKPTALRVAAAQGLALASSPAALTALGALVDDEEADIRKAARDGLRRVAAEPTPK
jgi:HEAT repeat protein